MNSWARKRENDYIQKPMTSRTVFTDRLLTHGYGYMLMTYVGEASNEHDRWGDLSYGDAAAFKQRQLAVFYNRRMFIGS